MFVLSPAATAYLADLLAIDGGENASPEALGELGGLVTISQQVNRERAARDDAWSRRGDETADEKPAVTHRTTDLFPQPSGWFGEV